MRVSGINEAGLSVALLWHEVGDYGTDNSFNRLNSLQWIQFQLDNYSRVDELIEGLQSIRPEQGPVPLHFTMLDSHGDSLIVEFIGSNSEAPLGNSIGRFAQLYRELSSGKHNVDPADGLLLLDTVSQSSKAGGVESFP